MLQTSNLTQKYFRNFHECVIRIAEGASSEEERLKAFYYLAKYIVTNSRSDESRSPEVDLRITMSDEDLLRGVSVAKFVNYFPIEKTYDGERWQIKDYFSTLKAIREHGDTIQDVSKFLWDYQNLLIVAYSVEKMCLISDAYRKETGKEPIEEFFGITPQYLYEIDGKQVLYNPETGQTTRVRKKRPRHLKVIR